MKTNCIAAACAFLVLVALKVEAQRRDPALEVGEGVGASGDEGGGKPWTFKITGSKKYESVIRAAPDLLCASWKANGLCDSNAFVMETCAAACSKEDDAKGGECAPVEAAAKIAEKQDAIALQAEQKKVADCVKATIFQSGGGSNKKAEALAMLGEDQGVTDQTITLSVTGPRSDEALIKGIPHVLCSGWKSGGLCSSKFVEEACESQCNEPNSSGKCKMQRDAAEEAAAFTAASITAAKLQYQKCKKKMQGGTEL